MKTYLIISAAFFSFSTVYFHAFGQKEKPAFKDYFNEYYVSVNHGIASSRTFFGAGLGASHVFQPQNVITFRTGVDLQFFHAWASSGAPAHYSSVQNIHRTFIDLTIPLVIRLNIKMVFIEFGGNLGCGMAGWERHTQSNFPPNQPVSQTEQKQAWNPRLSAGGTGGVGVLIPLNEKLELLVRSDFGASAYFQREYSNVYARLCIGIHIK